MHRSRGGDDWGDAGEARHGEDAQRFDVCEGAEYGAEDGAEEADDGGGERDLSEEVEEDVDGGVVDGTSAGARVRRGEEEGEVEEEEGEEELVGVRLLTEVALDEGLQESDLDADVVHPEGHERRGGDLPRGGGAGHDASKKIRDETREAVGARRRPRATRRCEATRDGGRAFEGERARAMRARRVKRSRRVKRLGFRPLGITCDNPI